MTPQNLTGKVALVTGGSRGIGMAIAESMVAEGMMVAITGREEAHLLAAKHRIKDAGPGRLETIVADVRQHDDVERAIDTVVLAYGGLDVLVNNAGVGIFTQVADMRPDQWSAILDTNLTGVYNCCHLAIPQLRKRGGGYIINISSLAGKNAFIGAAAYCASKAAVIAMTQSMAEELGPMQIAVNAICPGYLKTAMFTQVLNPILATLYGVHEDEVFERFVQHRTFLGRGQTPEDIAEAAVYLCRAENVTGITLTVAGGAEVH